jgi:hypothetical protein
MYCRARAVICRYAATDVVRSTAGWVLHSGAVINRCEVIAVVCSTVRRPALTRDSRDWVLQKGRHYLFLCRNESMTRFCRFYVWVPIQALQYVEPSWIKATFKVVPKITFEWRTWDFHSDDSEDLSYEMWRCIVSYIVSLRGTCCIHLQGETQILTVFGRFLLSSAVWTRSELLWVFTQRILGNWLQTFRDMIDRP